MVKGNKSIEKENLIVVEGKTDKVLIDDIIDLMENSYKEKVQIFELNGKNNLGNLKKLIQNSDIELNSILLILDKDENFSSTEQRAISFFNNLLQEFPSIKTRYIILPPKEMEGQELEDYIVEIILSQDNNISYIKDCIEKVSTPKKLGKKIFYTYLLLNDNCNYEGTSYSLEQIKGCIGNVITKMDYLIEQIKQFLEVESNTETDIK